MITRSSARPRARRLARRRLGQRRRDGQRAPPRARRVAPSAATLHDRSDRHHHPAERLGDLRAVPAAHRPGPIGLGVDADHRMAGRPGQPRHAGLHHLARPARPVDRERHRRLRAPCAPAHAGPARRRAARRPAGGAEAEATDDPRDPFAVEVLAGDDDDAAVAPVPHAVQDAAVARAHRWSRPRRRRPPPGAPRRPSRCARSGPAAAAAARRAPAITATCARLRHERRHAGPSGASRSAWSLTCRRTAGLRRLRAPPT